MWELRREKCHSGCVSDHDLISKPRSPQRVKAPTHVTVNHEHMQQQVLEEASAVFGWNEL